jgi:hypothetical protein
MQCTNSFYGVPPNYGGGDMTLTVPKKPSVDETRIGEYAASQPLSGVTRVDETTAVLGAGRGGFVRKEEAEKGKNRH